MAWNPLSRRTLASLLSGAAETLTSRSLMTPFSPSSSRLLSTRRTPRSRRRRRPPPLPPPDPSLLDACVARLPPRFSSSDLSRLLEIQRDPALCLRLFHWASQQPRFRHDASTFLSTIRKLGAARLYEDMDAVAAQALATPSALSEALFNTIIYFYAEARMLSKAVNTYKRMRDSPAPAACRPTLRTYNLLFTALLGKGSNTYINHLYMDTIRSLFRQMVDSGVEPDVLSLNAMIKGYVLSLHLNDALRLFNQMGVVYKCSPNEHSYNYLVHGLCAQGRTKNATELYVEMGAKGFVPSEKAYNSLACALAMAGEVEEAVRILWEMGEKRKMADFITYRTVLDEMCSRGRVGDAVSLLRELQETDLVDGRTQRELLYGIQDGFGREGGDFVGRRGSGEGG